MTIRRQPELFGQRWRFFALFWFSLSYERGDEWYADLKDVEALSIRPRCDVSLDGANIHHSSSG